MSGLPMGWAWAPIIAQFAAEGVTENIYGEIGLLALLGIHALVYIDNIIFALEEEAAEVVEEIVKGIINACKKAGACIKPDSLKIAKRVEWLGMEIDAETQTFRLKQSFVDKLLKARGQGAA